MTQRKEPYENYLAGVVGRDQMTDQAGRVTPGAAEDDVFLVVGKRVRRGSPEAWTVAERAETVAHATSNQDQPSSRASLTFSSEDQLALVRYLDLGRMEHDNDMIIDVVDALSPGQRNEEAWARIRSLP